MTKMRITAILPNTYEVMVAPWLTSVARKDITVVMSYPASDRQRRFLNLQDDVRLQKKYLINSEQYLWIVVDFRVDLFDDIYDFENLILRKIEQSINFKHDKEVNFSDNLKKLKVKNKKIVCLVAFGCEMLLNSQKRNVLIWFTNYNRLESLRFLLFFETNLYSADAISFFGNNPAFQPRIHLMKLYDKDNAMHFIAYLESIWGMSVKSSVRKIVVEKCAGMFLLIKEAMWYLRDHPNCGVEELFNHREMEFNLVSLWNNFADKDKETLVKIATQEKFSEHEYQSSLEYLRGVGMIAINGQRHQICVPLLESFILNKQLPKRNLVLSENEVLLNGVSVTAQFSKTERSLLMFLLNFSGRIVPREKIAETIWKNDAYDKYSDWAIDSTVSRLRKKLVQLGLPQSTILSKKGEGIIFQSPK